MSATFRQPSNLKRKRDHGFRKRMSTKNGRKVLAGGGQKDAPAWLSSDRLLGRILEMAGLFTSRLLFLRQSADIDRVKKLGRRCQTSLFTMLTYPSGLPYTRVGIVVGKRFGLAVKRNRVKRVFRELAR